MNTLTAVWRFYPNAFQYISNLSSKKTNCSNPVKVPVHHLSHHEFNMKCDPYYGSEEVTAVVRQLKVYPFNHCCLCAFYCKQCRLVNLKGSAHD